jgi:hypothetical protein
VTAAARPSVGDAHAVGGGHGDAEVGGSTRVEQDVVAHGGGEPDALVPEKGGSPMSMIV